MKRVFNFCFAQPGVVLLAYQCVKEPMRWIFRFYTKKQKTGIFMLKKFSYRRHCICITHALQFLRKEVFV